MSDYREDSRTGHDRRQCIHDVIYKTGNTVHELETWLAGHVEGQWNIALMDLTSSDLSTNIFRVMFERETDRELFRTQMIG